MFIIGNVPIHPPFLGDLYPNIEVFLPPNTTSLIQQMDQGVIAALKAHDLARTFAQVVAATEEDTEQTLMRFWKDHNICDAWGDVTRRV